MSRIKNVIKNAKVGLFFMVITFALGMVSRKIFLEQLGPDFIGLTTTLLGIIGFLSLAEMGLSVAVSSTLYKPLAEKDYETINNTIDFLGKAYKGIGFSVIILGLIVAVFLPHFFPNQGVDLKVVYYAYSIFIISVVIEYIFNYKQIILSADQKNYVITYCRDSLNIIKVLLQIFVIKLGFGEYAWLVIGLITSAISIVLINRYVNKNYSWLKSTGKSFKELYKESSEIVIKTRQLMVHKISTFVFHSSDSILIYKFTSLSTVAFISNYQVLTSVLITLASTLKSGLTAGIGSFVVSNSQSENYNLFKMLWLLHMLMSTFLVLMFYNISDSFITLWLGSQYIISHDILILLSMNLFLLLFRGVIDSFIYAYGIFFDTKAPIIEVIINIIISCLFGYLYGAVGVLFGTFISEFIIVYLWKPYLIYTKGFDIKYNAYCKDLVFTLIPIILVFTINYQCKINVNSIGGIIDWGLYAVKNVYLVLSLLFIIVIFNFNMLKVLSNRCFFKKL